MRLVHLCHVPLPPDHPDYGRLYSHPGRWVVNLALAQKAHTDIEPHLITMVPGATADFETTIEGLPVKFVKLPARFRAATLFWQEQRLLARAALECQPDVVHAHGTEESYALAAQRTGKPYAVTLQGVYAVINRLMPPKLISRARIQELMEHKALSRARDVIVKSDYIAKEAAQLFPKLRLHHIPNTFHPSLLDIPEVPRQPGSMVFVGMITPRKGLDILADALQHPTLNSSPATLHPSPATSPRGMRSYSTGALHIIGNYGEGGGEYDRMILSRFREILGQRLHLHGMVPSSQVGPIVAGCELLVAPSLEEMFGNQVIEALLAGTWPVVSSGTAMEENVKRIGAGTVFTNGNAEFLAKAILEAREHLPAWNRTETRQRILDWMGPEVVAKKHLELYKKLKC
jgi:glycosyltransferase involved in cell wall biosynthesis